MPGSRKNKKSGRKIHRKHEVPCENSVGSVENETKTNMNYHIGISETVGRYIVASRDIKPGELIMEVSPIVVGPGQNCQAQCVGCYRNLSDVGKHIQCKCRWPLCNTNCTGKYKEYGHSKAECNIIDKCKEHNDLLTDLKAYEAIVPLRCLLLQESNPDKWKILMTMEHHNNIRKKLPHLWSNNQKNVVDRIHKQWGLVQYEENLIHTICGVLEVNSFEVGQNGMNVRALYPEAFYFAHNCVPNTCHTDDEQYRLRVRATVKIPRGESVNISYTYTLQGTMKRGEHLRESKFFECDCARCADPSELGTYAGALKCSHCKTGSVLSTAPLNPDADWQCTNCAKFTLPASAVQKLMNRINEESENLNKNDVQALEHFIKDHREVLHENHYHNLGVLHSLCQLYGKAPGYIINDLTNTQLQYKVKICRHLLSIADVLDPGLSQLRGVLLYELHAPLMILTTRAMEEHSLSVNELRQRLKEVAAYLEEAKEILSFEPELSIEAAMGAAAVEAIHQLRKLQKTIICRR